HREGGDPPKHRENAGNIAEICVSEPELAHEVGEQHRQDEAVEADQAKRHAQRENDLPLVAGIPAALGLLLHNPPCFLIGSFVTAAPAGSSPPPASRTSAHERISPAGNRGSAPRRCSAAE